MIAESLDWISPFVRAADIVVTSSSSDSLTVKNHELIYIAEGEAIAGINGQTYPADRGSLILVPPFARRHIRQTSVQPLVQYVAHFDLAPQSPRPAPFNYGHRADDSSRCVRTEKVAIEISRPVVSLSYGDRLQFNRTFQDMYKEQSGRHRGYSLLSRAYMIEMLMLFIRNLEALPPNEGRMNASWAALKRSLDYIHSHYPNPDLDNGQISTACGLSSSHLSFLFRKLMGTSVQRYLSHVRVEEVKKQFSAGEATLSSIADSVGFSGIHQLSRSFKRMTGLAPSHYMTLQLRKGERACQIRGFI